MKSFVYQPQPARVLFGAGSFSRLREEVDRLGLQRCVVLSTPTKRELAERAASLLGDRAAGIVAGAAMHVPVESVAAAREQVALLRADGLVAMGGGSTIGLAKALALALETGLAIVAVPTTYSGSEMTPIYGITQGARKRTGRDGKVLPRTVLYDPELTLGLPVATSITSGMNAIAHAAEGLYAADANPVTDLMAEEGIRALAHALPQVHAEPRDLAARGEALYGAWLCGTVLGSVGMALHHKLCHTLGGSFDLPHAETHTVVLPHALAYNAKAAPGAMARIERALGGRLAPQAAYDLAARLGAPLSLREIGMPADGLERACELALQTPYPNPAPLEREPLLALLHAAFAGRRPE